MIQNIKIAGIGILTIIVLFATYAFTPKESGYSMLPDKIISSMLPKLSDYGIYEKNAADLIPSGSYKVYEPSSGSFTDYAEKQRLIKVPNGFKLIAKDDGLPDFPKGTILVKTFYYFNEGKKQIIETRVIIKTGTDWIAGTYKWNSEQTDALLITKGANLPVTFTDKKGDTRNINYHIPDAKDCAKCHKSNGEFLPIGIKIRNLNNDIEHNGKNINQLESLRNDGILAIDEISGYEKLPDWEDESIPLDKRARAYLDVNCAFCHSDGGYCSFLNIIKLRLGYEIPFEETRIAKKTERLVKLMSKKKMPYIGATIVDDEGLSLIKEYLKSIK